MFAGISRLHGYSGHGSPSKDVTGSRRRQNWWIGVVVRRYVPDEPPRPTRSARRSRGQNRVPERAARQAGAGSTKRRVEDAACLTRRLCKPRLRTLAVPVAVLTCGTNGDHGSSGRMPALRVSPEGDRVLKPRVVSCVELVVEPLSALVVGSGLSPELAAPVLPCVGDGGGHKPPPDALRPSIGHDGQIVEQSHVGCRHGGVGPVDAREPKGFMRLVPRAEEEALRARCDEASEELTVAVSFWRGVVEGLVLGDKRKQRVKVCH